MKTTNRICQNISVPPAVKQVHAEVKELAEMIINFPPEKRKVAEKFTAFIYGEATGSKSQFVFFSDLLPCVLTLPRNDKYRLSNALFNSAWKIRKDHQALADKLFFWADRIRLIAWNCKHPDIIRKIILSCVPIDSQNN